MTLPFRRIAGDKKRFGIWCFEHQVKVDDDALAGKVSPSDSLKELDDSFKFPAIVATESVSGSVTSFMLNLAYIDNSSRHVSKHMLETTGSGSTS